MFVSRERHGRHARQTPRNVQARLTTAVKAANVELVELGIEPIGKVSPHSLRRTYASLRAALRDDPVFIAEQPGHRDARFTFSTYQRAVKRREKLTGAYLEAFDRALDWDHWAPRAIFGSRCRIRPKRPGCRIPRCKARIRHRAAVAQLARASACHAEGRGFESHQPLRQKAPEIRRFLLGEVESTDSWASNMGIKRQPRCRIR